MKIEGALFSESDAGDKAVVQVKAKKASKLCAKSFKEYIDDGYLVYVYCPEFDNDLEGADKDKAIEIGKEELLDFVKEKGNLLPDNIMMWEDLFSSIPEDPDK